MFGLLMMSVPLGIAVSLSTVALVWTEFGRRRRGYFGPKAARSSMTDISATSSADPSAEQGGFMRMHIIVLAASIVLTGCVSDSGSRARPPNYVSSQAYQGPAIRNDTFGGAAMPMRSAPR